MNQKRLISLILTVVMMLGMCSGFALPSLAASTVWDGSAASSFAAGSGSEADPYIIRTPEQLAYLGQLWNSYTSENFHVRLESDIYLNSTTGWESWGDDADGSIVAPANNWSPIKRVPSGSVFDGNGYTVYGMYVGGKISEAGLFGIVSGTLMDLNIAASFVDGNYYTGAFCGNLDYNGYIINCHNSGNVRGEYGVGGICGGYMAVQEVHGDLRIMDCSNSGAVSGDEAVGGICGTMDEFVGRCYNSGSVTGVSTVGGIVGTGNAEQCFNSGAVTGTEIVGGIAGNALDLKNCYNIASVSATSKVGGLGGRSSWGTEILNCYNVGSVSGSSDIGGLIGDIGEETAFTKSYCLETVLNDIPADQSATADELGEQSFFEDWNFYSVWELDYDDDYSYPTLRVFGSKYYRYIFKKQSLELLLSTEIIEDGTEYTFTAPTHEGYDFLYWECDGEIYKAEESIKAKKDMIFTAYWAMPNTDAGVWQGDSDTSFEGSGTQNDPYLISTSAELAGLAKNVADGNTYKGKYISLTADLLLNDPADAALVQETVFCTNQWTSIGTEKHHFEGTFDGNDHSIKGLFMKGGYGGLFGFNYGTIKNVRVEDSYIDGEFAVGTIAAENFGLIENCHSAARIIALSYDERPLDGIGGIVGANGRYAEEPTATVKNCTNSGTVTLGTEYETYYDTAGVVGYNDAIVIGCANSGVSKAGIVTYNDAGATVTDCTNTGAVTGAGIVCYNEGTVSGCSNTADIETSASIPLAGIVSQNCGKVQDCYNTGDVRYLGTSEFPAAGGIVADSGSTVLPNDVFRCYNTGNISGRYNVGGIIGEACGYGEYSISNVIECYNSGTVSGIKNVGGIVGQGERDYTYVRNCYNTATVSGESNVGGIAGHAKNVECCYNIAALSGAADPIVGLRSVPGTENNYTDLDPTIENNYYLDSTFSGTTENGAALSATALQQKDSFAGWNFDSVWELGYNKEYAYPTLRPFGSQEYFYNVTLTEGDMTLSKTLYPKGTVITMSPSDAESEYDFAYWRNGDERLYVGDSLTVTEDVTLVAIRSVPNTTPGVWNGGVDTNWAGGGTSGDPYLISTPEELAGVAKRVNDGYDQSAHFKLTADILLNDGGELFSDTLVGKNEWIPIGTDYEHRFRGGFDGDGYTVSGLYINGSDDYVGLFGEVQCDIKNLHIEDSYICGEYCVGAVMGRSNNDSKIINCFSNATVVGGYNVGGIVAYGSRTIIDRCINEGNVSGKTSGVAGIIGNANGLGIIKSINRGQITGGGSVGGLVGSVVGQLSYMQNCSNNGSVNASGQYAGGLIGYSMSNTTIQYSYNSGDVIGNTYVGGLVGQLGYNCTAAYLYNCGTVTGEKNVGGLLGGGASSTLFNAYNVGDVFSPNAHDGVLGKTDGVTVFNTNYKDTETSATSATALSDEQMRTESAYDFTFGSDWEFGGAYENYPYPTLTDTAHAIVDYNKYTVTFVDYDDSVLGTDEVSRHETATAPDTSELWYKEGDYVYAFSHWDKQLTNVTESMTVKAVYQKTKVIGIVSGSAEVSVPRGFSADNLSTLLESRYGEMICLTDDYYHVISKITWDISGYDPNGADRQVFFGELALTRTPYYELLDKNAPFGVVVYLTDENADSEFKVEDLSYSVNADGSSITITRYNGSAFEIVVPSVIDGYQVTAIGEDAFWNSTTTHSVILPNTVKTIGQGAFAACPNLVEIVLPEGLTSIDESAFSDTGLTDITLPRSLKSIDTWAVGYNIGEKQPGFVIYAYEGSAAAVYAEKNGFELITLQQLTDERTGVTADADSSLRLAVLTVPDGDYYDAAAAIAPDAAVSLYEITLRDNDNEETQPDNNLTVSIPVPAGMTGSACSVYRINADGSYQNMNAVLTDGRLVFTTAHLSYYAVIDDLLPAPTVLSITTNAVTLKEEAGFQYKYEGGSWQQGGTFTGLNSGVTYTFVAREIASGKVSGAVSITTVGTAPAAPTLASKTQTSVTLKKVNGCEYRCGNGAWQSSPTFTGLKAGTSYTFYQRYAATDTNLASEVSKGFTVTTKSKATLAFTDVKKNDYYYDAVAWAVELGVTTGTSNTTFGPAESCTRAQAVTFLWRAAGSPAPKGSQNPFKDVKRSDYFYKAVLWAAENNVTSGTTKSTFSPNDVCTRGQIVTFLWRAQSGKKVSAVNPFKDVKSNDYYYNAVLWAVKNGVTTGTSETTFSPAENCTRGQIVTFLYRAVK